MHCLIKKYFFMCYLVFCKYQYARGWECINKAFCQVVWMLRESSQMQGLFTQMHTDSRENPFQIGTFHTSIIVVFDRSFLFTSYHQLELMLEICNQVMVGLHISIEGNALCYPLIRERECSYSDLRSAVSIYKHCHYFL